jgi:hypothetical protein
VNFSNVTQITKDIVGIGGRALLSIYNDSPPLLITSVFPEYNLLPWKFATIPRNFWSNVANQRKFFDWASEQLGIKEHTDWYKIRIKVDNKMFKV